MTSHVFTTYKLGFLFAAGETIRLEVSKVCHNRNCSFEFFASAISKACLTDTIPPMVKDEKTFIIVECYDVLKNTCLVFH